jgi:exodeoxyribonuclease-5
MDITLSDAQHKAIEELKSWFVSTERKPVFRIFGFAGSGKSTIVKYALAELGIGPHECGGESGFLAATFTGKAALVMTRKGTPASTIHSLIYRVSAATKEEIERVKEDIAAIKAKLPTLGQRERFLEESRLRSLEIRLADIHKPRFVLNEQSIVRDAKLIVLDEVSMVGEEMARDLLAFGKPILVLGDPGQLPPITVTVPSPGMRRT